eukprot:symbB.v1.2.040133.t1/scaffold7016.1/size13829/2
MLKSVHGRPRPSCRPSSHPKFRARSRSPLRGADGNWARSVPSAPSTLWNESWDDGNDVGAVPTKEEEPVQAWETDSVAAAVTDDFWRKIWDDGADNPGDEDAVLTKEEEFQEDIENDPWRPSASSVPRADWNGSWDDDGAIGDENAVPTKEEEQVQDYEENAPSVSSVPRADCNESWDDNGDDSGWSQKEDWSNWKKSWNDSGKDSWKDSWEDWSSWKNHKEGWKDDWQDSKPSKKSRKNSEPSVLYAQAYITDIPVYFDEHMVKAMHSQCKVPKEDLPISVKFLPSKDATGETCSCIVRYAKEETLEHVLQEMAGKQIQLKSGKIKKIGVKRARPARWMIEARVDRGHSALSRQARHHQAGLAKDAEQPKKQKAAKDWRDWDEVGSKEPFASQ